MARRTKKPPVYRHFKARDLAVVRIDGRDHYLGRYGSPESHEAYLRLLAERSISPPRTPAVPNEPPVASLTIDSSINCYHRFAAVHYQRDGRPEKNTRR